MCKKEEKKSERFILLTAHDWKIDSLLTICQDPEIANFVYMMDSALKGLSVYYNADGSFISPFESGGWMFSNAETEIITFDDEDPSDIYGHVRIDQLTEEVLEVTDLADVPPSDTCYVKMNLKK